MDGNDNVSRLLLDKMIELDPSLTLLEELEVEAKVLLAIPVLSADESIVVTVNDIFLLTLFILLEAVLIAFVDDRALASDDTRRTDDAE